MRVEVLDSSRSGDQTRAYAEYRVFSTLSHFAASVRHALVTLAPARAGGGGPPGETAVLCTVTVTMTDSRHAAASARGPNACGAIDLVASRLRSQIEQGALAPGDR
jgi:hypothetical protein